MIKRLLNNKLFKDSFVYVVSDVINAMIPIILLPILTKYLSTEDYGKLAIFDSILTFVVVFVGIGIINLINVNFFIYGRNRFKFFLGNAYLIIFVLALIVLMIYFTLSYFISSLLPIHTFLLIIALALLNIYNFIFINILILEKKTYFYGFFQIFLSITKLLFSIYFVVVLFLSWKGRVYGMLIGSLIGLLLSIVYLTKNKFIKFSYSKLFIKEIINYYLPLIPHQLSGWFKTGMTILLLGYFANKTQAGFFDLALKFVIPISILATAINKAWTPFFYNKLSNNLEEKGKVKIVKLTYIIFISLIFTSFIIIILSPHLFSTFLDTKYIPAIKYVFILSIATSINSLYPFLINYIYFSKKTKYASYVTITSSIISIIMTVILFKIYGDIGVAYAFLLTSLTTFALLFYFVNKIYPMPWFFFIKKI